MSGTKNRGILVSVDGSAASDAAVAWATREATMRALPITLMHAVPPVVVGWPAGQLYADMPDWQRESAQQVLDQARKEVTTQVDSSETPEIHTEMTYSSVLPTLVDASRDAWIIVAGNEGLGALGRLLLGSVTAGLLHHAHCPVAVIHADEDATPGHNAPVLVGTDGSPASEAAIALAFDEASRRGVDLVALHAWSDVGVFPMLGMDWRDSEARGHEILAERLAGWQEHYPDVRVKRLIVCDKPSRWLLQEAEHAQLVVVGSHGRGGFAGMLLGSVSSHVAQSATVPVIVARSS
ncbi:universal stress protein [Mycobacterium intracellulare]|uniref:Universal stress protein n=1 Tax=Mycobacterium intracellulare subsp. chimaera TaxID=222805 RepID=A0A7U5MKD5_MYCIT|nr:universal stress protein [Mycobacterium intracellulare]ASL15164.1 universal stress protein [Mycobacterium intracellulare subsp. chimaera]ASQ86348.1 universal stress protein [Mycobacterium intracellulare subsp. chimaera]MCF1815949.1 universal stress protein [Mycobacterium intracellulare subsp. intracellulare]MDM3929458.1 universal stress protein [Mycobacterium intracellulare subsp. chimaera]MDS0337857.1 universal stress protein [Mycobacterium intracellulare]